MNEQQDDDRFPNCGCNPDDCPDREGVAEQQDLRRAVEALIEEYQNDAANEPYGGEPWSTTEARLSALLAVEAAEVGPEDDPIRRAVMTGATYADAVVTAEPQGSDESGGGLTEAVEKVLAEHVMHAGGGGRWFAECLATDCDWSEQGTGGLVFGIEAHRTHLAATIECVVESALGQQADIEREAFGRGVEWASGAGMRQRWEATEAALATARREVEEMRGERDDLMALAVEDTHRRGVVKAERDDLRARLGAVEALADEWESGDLGYPEYARVFIRELRAALANPSAAQGEGEVGK